MKSTTPFAPPGLVNSFANRPRGLRPWLLTAAASRLSHWNTTAPRPLHSKAGPPRFLFAACFCLMGLSCLAADVRAAEVKLVRNVHDPHGTPRPDFDQRDVPPRTSFYIELAVSGGTTGDIVEPDSVTVSLQAEGAEAVTLLSESQKFAPGYRGKVFPHTDWKIGKILLVYIDSDKPLLPKTAYTVQTTARSLSGATLPAKSGAWHFQTEAPSKVQPVEMALAADAPTVHWHGGFFTGFCNVTFMQSMHRLPTFELMEEVRRTAPKAWSLQRDFWFTGMDQKPDGITVLPNLVRERETRRITAIDRQAATVVLHVEDFFGHEQYGIPSNRPLSGDYHPGDEILVADLTHDARAKVLAVDDAAKSVQVTSFATPTGGWGLEYWRPLPKSEDPRAPGLFPPGGTYLRKFAPCGRPVYYWGRVHKEWDLAVRQYNRRLVVNFADAPGDLSIDGRNWNTAKDYLELHEVARTVTGHLIERYGKATLDFYWSIFNEPNLPTLFWHCNDWNELQTFYDYTVDGMLRAFEDHGYDSRKVMIGGLDYAGIFVTEPRAKLFLTHCSPKASATGKGVIPKNVAYADSRLNGKRSKRVEDLCSAHAGRGTPCDFISVHTYRATPLTADRFFWVKQTALEIDPEYYAHLAINSHEACPGWQQLPDPAYQGCYMGNGFFETWCADVARRQLARAAQDARYSYGETILTYWPGPPRNFGGGDDFVREVHVADESGRDSGRAVTVPMPIMYTLGLMAQMGDDYQVFPEQTFGSHVVSGMIARTGDKLRVLVYSHSPLDTESRSGAEFDVRLRLTGLTGPAAAVHEYRFDSDHNSAFRLCCQLRDGPHRGSYPAEAVKEVQRQSQMRETSTSRHDVGADGVLQLRLRVAGNGANFLVIERAGPK